jgi:three-Cys-motif partner protein
MNQFGGPWTVQKIDIIVKYTKAYLKIMNRKPWPILYFDGFAGTGEINTENEDFDIIEGAAKKILDINVPRFFDMYYFVELDNVKTKKLKLMTDSLYSNKEVHVITADCNDKLIDLSNFLRSPKGRKFKVLAFIDPCGMELNWKSLESLKGLGIDLWILVPTGVGANRLLKKDGKTISDAWLQRLEIFLGITRQDILNIFYQPHKDLTLFGDIDILEKERNAIGKVHDLYKNRIGGIFNFVSDSFALRNSMNSIMYHFFMATNNANAFNIANDIVKKYKL